MKTRKALQFKIILRDVYPSVWRRILVPAQSSFWDLHTALQDAMGWSDSHLHDFSVPSPEGVKHFGIPDPDGEDYGRILPGWEHRIADYLTIENPKAEYCYDFGDCWIHSLVPETITTVEGNQGLPQCIAGQGACPPEDCGGAGGYLELLKTLADPHLEGHRELKKWMGGIDFDAEYFDPADVTFTDPEERLNDMRAAIGPHSNG